MEEKIEIIDKISQKHPGHGVERGWSEYTGGMKDSGQWFFRKMIDVECSELQTFLDNIIKEENQPIREYTPDELKDQKIIIETKVESGGKLHYGYMTEFQRKLWDEFKSKREAKFMFGNKIK